MTSYGATPAICQVLGWFNSGGGTNVNVLCYSPAGTPLDTTYDILYTH